MIIIWENLDYGIGVESWKVHQKRYDTSMSCIQGKQIQLDLQLFVNIILVCKVFIMLFFGLKTILFVIMVITAWDKID